MTAVAHPQDIVSIQEKVDPQKLTYIFAGLDYRSLVDHMRKCLDSYENDPIKTKSQNQISDSLKETKHKSCLFNFEDLGTQNSSFECDVLSSLASVADHQFISLRQFFLKFVSPVNAAAGRFPDTDARCSVLKYYTSPPVSTSAGLFRPQSIPNILNFKSDKFNVKLTNNFISEAYSDMKYEHNRLMTFKVKQHLFPAADKVRPEDLAATGFYYIFEDDKVQCAFCKGNLKDWAAGDDPAYKHRLHYATCPFILYMDVGNIPIVKNTELKISQQCTDSNPTGSDGRSISYVSCVRTLKFGIDYKDVLPAENRDVPSHILQTVPPALQQCQHSMSLSKESRQFESLQFEQRHHSKFPVSLEVAEAACSRKSLENLTNLSNNISTLSNPEQFYPQKHPDYKDLDRRLKSFETWYPWLIPHWLMAKAGFFFSGGLVSRAGVECFWCGVCINSWHHVDNPWIEHARWSPRCVHVLLNRGADFVLMVHQVAPPYTPNPILPSDEDFYKNVKSYRRKEKIGTANSEVSASKSEPLPVLTYDNIIGGRLASIPIAYRVEPRDIKGRLDLASVRIISIVGFNHQEVRVALDLHMREAGDDFKTSELLIDAVWKQKETIQELGLDVDEYQLNRFDEIKRDLDRLKERTTKRDLPTGDWRLCKICMDNEVNVVFLNCGHLCSCHSCAPSMKTCPICRAPIRGTINTFPS